MHQGRRKVVTTFRPSKRETALELDPRKALLAASDLEQEMEVPAKLSLAAERAEAACARG
jgi:hypothetical protein